MELIAFATMASGALMVVAGATLDKIYTKKVGGVRFLKIGRRVFTTCVAKQAGPIGKR